MSCLNKSTMIASGFPCQPQPHTNYYKNETKIFQSKSEWHKRDKWELPVKHTQEKLCKECCTWKIITHTLRVCWLDVVKKDIDILSSSPMLCSRRTWFRYFVTQCMVHANVRNKLIMLCGVMHNMRFSTQWQHRQLSLIPVAVVIRCECFVSQCREGGERRRNTTNS